MSLDASEERLYDEVMRAREARASRPNPNPNPDPHPNPRMTRAQRRQEDLFKQREEVLQRREQRLED